MQAFEVEGDNSDFEVLSPSPNRSSTGRNARTSPTPIMDNLNNLVLRMRGCFSAVMESLEPTRSRSKALIVVASSLVVLGFIVTFGELAYSSQADGRLTCVGYFFVLEILVVLGGFVSLFLLFYIRG